jgi:hypothetical protein
MLRRASAALLPRLLQQQGGAGAAPLAAATTHVPAFSWGDDKPSASGAQVFRREWVGPWPRCGAANLSTRLSTAQCPRTDQKGEPPGRDASWVAPNLLPVPPSSAACSVCHLHRAGSSGRSGPDAHNLRHQEPHPRHQVRSRRRACSPPQRSCQSLAA